MNDQNVAGNEIRKGSVEKFLEEVEAKTAAPGGGSVASVAGALGASLLHMTAAFSVDHESNRDHEQKSHLEEIRERSRELLDLAEADRRSYEEYQELQRKENSSKKEIQEALLRSTRIPMRISACCEQLIRSYLDLRDHLKPSFQADVSTALELIRVNWHSASELAAYNLSELPDGSEKRSLQDQLKEREKRLNKLFERIEHKDK